MKSGLTIKLNAARMLLLRAAMKKEELRLQNTASQVARIAAGLEMEVAAKSNIDASLNNLRKQLKQDSEYMGTMQRMADLAIEELSKKDEDLANQARGLNYTAQQIVGATSPVYILDGGAVNFTTAAGSSGAMRSPLDLTSQLIADAAQKIGGLFGLAGDGVGDALQGVSLEQLAAGNQTSAAGSAQPGQTAGALAVLAGAGMAITTALDAILNSFSGKGSTSGKTTTKKTTSSKTTAKKTSSKKKSMWDKLGDKLGDAGAWVAGKAEDAVDAATDAVKDGAKWVGDKVEEAAEAVTDGAKWVGEKASDAGEWVSDKAGDIWKAAKTVADSKPVEYLWDMGGSVVGGGADILSFCGNVSAGKMGEAVLDGYSFVNDFFDFCQDSTALFYYGAGAGMEALGAKQSAVDRQFALAEEYANRGGLADELHGSGFEGIGYMVDYVDFSVGTYKTVTGLGKLGSTLDGMSWSSLGDLKDNLFTLSGWKDVDSLKDAADLSAQIDHYKDFSSNVKLGYKYVDGAFGEDGLLLTALKNTSAGKPGVGLITTIEDYLDLLKEVSESD